MDLEKLNARLRPRNPSEAQDLGTCMIRSLFGPVFVPWLIVTVPAAALALGFLGGWGVVLMWWLLPIFDRVPLFVLSRAIFGDVPRTARVLREVPRMLTRFLIWPLTLGRLSVFRTFLLPVSELEQQRGRNYSQRARVLRIDQDRGAWGLSFMMFGVVLCAWISLIIMVGMLFNVFLGSLWEEFGLDREFDYPAWIWWLLVSCMLLAEPFLVASGFALYLNRRQDLEGWDIELTFRRLASRLRKMQPEAADEVRKKPIARSRTLGALLVLGLSGAFLPAQSEAQGGGTTPVQAEASNQDPTDPQVAIKAVLEHEDFSDEMEFSQWQYTGGGMNFNGPSLAGFGPLILYTIAALGLAFLAWALYKLVQSFGSRRAQEDGLQAPPPAEVLGLDVRIESLPDDPAAEAWRLWQAGDAAGCLGLLYRGALSVLIHERELEVRRSATEADCVRLVGQIGAPSLTGYFRGLTSTWQSCAYGHRTPATERARMLCEQWGEHFRPGDGGRA